MRAPYLLRLLARPTSLVPRPTRRHLPFSRALSSQRPSRGHDLLTLAIETSCDDTCVALLSKSSQNGAATLLFNAKVTSDNRAVGGVHPVIAVQGHSAALAALVHDSLAHLPAAEDGSNALVVRGQARQKPDFVTVTRGPGMLANLYTGLNTAKGLATAWQVPLLGVNHMQAHALTPRLVSALERRHDSDGPAAPEPAFPFLSLLVSGGHTLLVHSRALANHQILVEAENIAIGDALDKCARMILPPELVASCPDVMYGRLLETFVFPDGDHGTYVPPRRRIDEITPYVSSYGWDLTAPLSRSRKMVYDFSGFSSHVQRIVDAKPEMDATERRELGLHTMRMLFEHLASRLFFALDADPESGGMETLVVSGGVASNRFLMHILRSSLDARGFGHMKLVAPPPSLCTDNAAMIAWTGMEMYEAGYATDLSVLAVRKWPLDPRGIDGGILGLDGWIRRDDVEE